MSKETKPNIYINRAAIEPPFGDSSLMGTNFRLEVPRVSPEVQGVPDFREKVNLIGQIGRYRNEREHLNMPRKDALKVKPEIKPVIESKLPPSAEQIKNAPSLKDLDRRVLDPSERKDRGKIEYVTVPETVSNWAKDPYGTKKFEFIQKAYGIPEEKLPAVLEEAGMSEYFKAKQEGRMVGMAAAQLLKPTYYFLSNAFVLADLNRKGIPTAFMVGEYPNDKFHTANSDKRDSFGKVDFPVGIKTKTVDGEPHKEMQTVQIELRPYGIRHDNGEVKPIKNIDEANGYRCEQVLVQVVDARSTDKKPYPKKITDHDNGMSTVETPYRGALGMDIPGLVNTREFKNKLDTSPVNSEAISITDFYKTLWVETISTLRKTGDLPSEKEMPMFFVNASRMYTVLAEHAKPPQEVLEILKFDTKENVLRDVLQIPKEDRDVILSGGEVAPEKAKPFKKEHEVFSSTPEKTKQEVTVFQDPETAYKKFLQSKNLKQLDNGLLVHLNGVMDPGSYYPAQTAWPDVYLECSSCGGDYFVNRLERSQKVREHYNLPESEVRIPDTEVPEMEKFVVHPTLKYYDEHMKSVVDFSELSQQLEELSKLPKTKEIKKKRNEISSRIAEVTEKKNREHFEEINQNEGKGYTEVKAYIPDPVAATYKMFLTGVEEAVSGSNVQQSIEAARYTSGLR